MNRGRCCRNLERCLPARGCWRGRLDLKAWSSTLHHGGSSTGSLGRAVLHADTQGQVCCGGVHVPYCVYSNTERNVLTAAERQLMADCEAAVRHALASEPTLAKYADALCAHAVDLLAAADDRETLHSKLKGMCGVCVIGHRHRAAALLGRAKAERACASSAAAPSSSSDLSVSAATAGTERAAPAATADTVLSAPAAAAASSSNLASRMASMIRKCDVHTGPLPFVVTPGLRQKNGCNRGEHMPISTNYPGLCKVHTSPPIYLCEHFASDAECDALVRCADPLLLRSMTDSGVSHVRTSRSTHLRKGTPPCPSLLAKVHALTRKPASHMEVPQVARYALLLATAPRVFPEDTPAAEARPAILFRPA